MEKMSNDSSKMNEIKLIYNSISKVENNIKILKDTITNLKSELSLCKQLVALANRELLDLPGSNKKDRQVLIADRNFFEGEVAKLNHDIYKQEKSLNKLMSIKKANEYLLDRSKNKLSIINEIIKYYPGINDEDQHNFMKNAVIYNHNNLSVIEKKKILVNDKIGTEVLYDQLSNSEQKEKNDINKKNNIELVGGYDNSNIKSQLTSDIDDFIFEVQDNNKSRKTKNKSTTELSLKKQLERDGFISFANQNHKSKRKKIKNIKKSLNKNMSKVFTDLFIVGHGNSNIKTQSTSDIDDFIFEVQGNNEYLKENNKSISKSSVRKQLKNGVLTYDNNYNEKNKNPKIKQSSSQNISKVFTDFFIIGHDNSNIKTQPTSDIDDFIFEVQDNNKSRKTKNKSTTELSLKKQLESDGFISFANHNPKSKRKKIKSIKKSLNWGQIKKSLKKKIRNVLVGLLVGTTMLFATQIGAGDTNNVNSKTSVSITEESIATKDEEVNIIDSENEIINKDYEEGKETTTEIDDIKEDNNDSLSIGDIVEVNSDIYIDANDAIKKENAMPSYYSSADERRISIIAYSNGDNCDYITVTKDNQDKIKELEKLKYDVVAYCVSNDSQNIEYEGWHNIEDIKVKRY